MEVTDMAPSCPVSTVQWNGKTKHVSQLGIARIVHMHGILHNIHVSGNSVYTTQVSSHQYSLCVVYFYLIWLLITIWQPVFETNRKVTNSLICTQNMIIHDKITTCNGIVVNFHYTYLGSILAYLGKKTIQWNMWFTWPIKTHSGIVYLLTYSMVQSPS
jgi:hypothetical protein